MLSFFIGDWSIKLHCRQGLVAISTAECYLRFCLYFSRFLRLFR